MIVRDSVKNPTNMLSSPFYNEAKYVGKGGFYKGNSNYQCVNYAIGRTCEIANREVCYYNGISTKDQIEKPLMNRSGYGNAKNWLNDTLWEKGSEARIGAIMVYGKNWGSGLGHVRVVEKIEDDKIFYSAGNESGEMAFKWISKPTITANGFLGYIYNPYVSHNNLIKIEQDENYDWVWSVDGNKYDEKYSATTQNGFNDDELVKQGYELVLKVNGSIFYQYENDFFACGLEKSRGKNNQDVSMSCVSKYNDCMSVCCYGNDLYFGKQDWAIKNMLNISYGAITGMGLLMSGVKRNDLHKGFEEQWSCKSGRTIIGEDEDGNIMSLSIEADTGSSKGITCYEAQDLCLSLGFYNAVAFDGGGSVFRWYNGNYDISSNRKVKNALLLYRKKKQTEEVVEDIEQLKSDYKLLKEAYDISLEVNEQLKEKLNEIEEEKDDLTNRLTEAEKGYNEALSKLEKIKDILR